MWLHQDLIDLVDIHLPGFVSNCFQHRPDAEVSGSSQHSFGRANHQRQSIFGERVVWESYPLELVLHKLFQFGRPGFRRLSVLL